MQPAYGAADPPEEPLICVVSAAHDWFERFIALLEQPVDVYELVTVLAPVTFHVFMMEADGLTVADGAPLVVNEIVGAGGVYVQLCDAVG